MDAVLALIGVNGKCKIYVSGGGTQLAEFDFPSPSGTVSGDTLTFDCDPDLTDLGMNTGTAAEATITTSAGTVVVSGLTVGTSGTDVIISPSTTITSGQTVNLLTLSIQHG